MSMIYEPQGRAKEYSDLAMNIYNGCSHGCLYCFGPKVLHRSKEEFYGNIDVLKKFSLKGISREAKKLTGNGCNSPVLLCFTCDPYQPLDSELKLTREVIQTINENGLPVQILTKGGLNSMRDFDLLKQNPNNCYAATLTCTSDDESQYWEPNASLPHERIEALRYAHQEGIQTWVSFEPVVCPDAVYKLIELTHEFVDLYKVGKLNYHPLSKTIDWQAFKQNAIDLLDSYGKEYYIKNDLRDC